MYFLPKSSLKRQNSATSRNATSLIRTSRSRKRQNSATPQVFPTEILVEKTKFRDLPIRFHHFDVIIRSHILILGIYPTVKQYGSNVGRVSYDDVKMVKPQIGSSWEFTLDTLLDPQFTTAPEKADAKSQTSYHLSA